MKQEQASTPTLAAAAAASAVVLSEHTAIDVALDDTGKDSFDQSSEDFMSLQEPEVLVAPIPPAPTPVILPAQEPTPVPEITVAEEPEAQSLTQEIPQIELIVPPPVFSPSHDLMKREENLPAIPPEYRLLTRTENHPVAETYNAPVQAQQKIEISAPVPVNNPYRPQQPETVSEAPAPAPVNYFYTSKPSEVISATPSATYEPVYAHPEKEFAAELPLNPMPPAPVPQQPWQITPAQMPVAPITPNQAPAPKEDDDSGLYSMRNF
jgi:hypothetical protein